MVSSYTHRFHFLDGIMITVLLKSYNFFLTACSSYIFFFSLHRRAVNMARFLEKTWSHELGRESKALRGFYCNNISRLWIPAIPYSPHAHTDATIGFEEQRRRSKVCVKKSKCPSISLYNLVINLIQFSAVLIITAFVLSKNRD